MSFLEWYLQLPARPEGEDVGWSIVLQSARPTGFAEWVIAIVVAALAGISLISYFRQSRELSPRLRAMLLSLRTAVVVLVGLLLAGFGLTAQSVGRPTLILLLDTSASMSVRDAAGIAGEDDDPPERLQVAISTLLNDDARVLRTLVDRYRLRIYQFGGSAELITSIDTVEQIEDSLDKLRQLEAAVLETRPAAAVAEVLQSLRGQPIAALVTMTDGVSSTGADDSWSSTAVALTDASVPLTAIPIGAESPVTEIQIVDAFLPETAWIGQPVSFLVQLRCLGADGQQVEVELRQVGHDEVASRESITIEGDEVRAWVSLPITPTASGPYEYEASVVPLEDEREHHNNRVVRPIDVREGRIRVLLVERLPRWEFRHLKAILERDALIELRTVLLWADPRFVDEDATALPAFPATREELLGIGESGETSQEIGEPLEVAPSTSPAQTTVNAGYDVIIWGDVDPASLLPDALANVQDFVRLNGGGLILIAGMQHNPWSYFDSPLTPLLPFPVEGFDAPQPPAGVSSFRQQRTPEGRTCGFLRFDNDPELDNDIWESLPAMNWLLPIDRLKAGAQALATHPSLRGTSGNMPTIIYQRYGAGQVVYLATDEFWQWRHAVEDRVLGRFWSQMIRTLAPPDRDDELLEEVQLISLQPVYAEGESIRFRVDFGGGTHYPENGSGEVVVESDSVVFERIPLSPSEHHATSLEGSGATLPPGTYRAWLASPTVPGTLPSCRFLVDAGQRELLDTVVDRQELERAAVQTGGSLVELSEIGSLADLLPSGRRIPTSEVIQIPLWSRPEALLLLTLLLTAEWLLRRRHRLI